MIESVIVVAIILGALGYLGVRISRTVKAARATKDGSCGGGCCSSDH